jgi:hypothetical protein
LFKNKKATMTVGHLLFAAVLTGYMGLAAFIEERDLVEHFGLQYEDYQRRVPMFMPRLTAPRRIPKPGHSWRSPRAVTEFFGKGVESRTAEYAGREVD